MGSLAPRWSTVWLALLGVVFVLGAPLSADAKPRIVPPDNTGGQDNTGDQGTAGEVNSDAPPVDNGGDPDAAPPRRPAAKSAKMVMGVRVGGTALFSDWLDKDDTGNLFGIGLLLRFMVRPNLGIESVSDFQLRVAANDSTSESRFHQYIGATYVFSVAQWLQISPGGGFLIALTNLTLGESEEISFDTQDLEMLEGGGYVAVTTHAVFGRHMIFLDLRGFVLVRPDGTEVNEALEYYGYTDDPAETRFGFSTQLGWGMKF